MEGEKKTEIRFYIFTRFKLGKGAKDIHDELCAVHGDSIVSYPTVRRWITAFKNGRQSIEDESHFGRPKEVVNEHSIANVQRILNENPRTTIRILSLELGLSTHSIHNILHHELHMRKVCARWIPHLLTEAQKKTRVQKSKELLAQYGPGGKNRLTDIVTGDECWIHYFGIPNKLQNMVWLGEDEPRPVVLRQGFRSRKSMFTIFFNHTGPVLVNVLPKGLTINARYYSSIVLPQVVKNIEKERPKTGVKRVKLLHDNASSHKAGQVTQYLQQQKFQVLDHPPYSPDLAPCDFWLFPKLKTELAGHVFNRPQDLSKAVNSVLKSIPLSEYRNVFDTWIWRLQRCIEVNGDYFEGMM
jgi:histone-lysine N-methyltransferase SETMAR